MAKTTIVGIDNSKTSYDWWDLWGANTKVLSQECVNYRAVRILGSILV